MSNKDLSIINVTTGEILMTLDEWLHDHRRKQLQLILAQLGGSGEGARVDPDEMARALFARREETG